MPTNKKAMENKIMMNFKGAVQNIYLPSYKELYALKKSDSKKYVHHKLNFIVNDIINKDNTVYALDVVEACKRAFKIKSTATRATIDNALYNVMYALAEPLSFYNNHDIGDRIENESLRIGNHYSANVDIF